jgi:hypothetical protein
MGRRRRRVAESTFRSMIERLPPVSMRAARNEKARLTAAREVLLRSSKS